MIDQLERLAEAGALIRRQRDRVVPPGVLQPVAPPYAAADLDNLAGTADRRIVGHTVPALDNLRPGCPDAEHEPAAGYIVETGRRHRGECRRPGVKLQDARGNLQPLRLRGDEPELADRVIAVCLGDEDDVEPGL